MPSDAKERIRERLDIAEVVGESVALKPSGKGRLKGLCPFHSEKTPSFHVLQDKGFYYCFGCQAKGDVFDFVMNTQGVQFYEALAYLGQRVGVEVTPATPQTNKRRDLFDVNKVALEFFRTNLLGVANDYLVKRKLTPESIERFELGYAPDGWDNLLKYALNKGIAEGDLLDAGLLAESDSGRRYDRFRNRIIFPIKDYLGRTVGFSGRVLDDSLPKYLNTPETDVFNKGELLYGLDLAKSAIRDSGECIVVEGYMDVIALHQTGFENAVAALGATLTAGQAAQLSRLDVSKLLLAFDADEAGQRAVLSGLEQSVGRQFLVRAVRVPHGKDPAEAVLDGFADEFRAALTGGVSEVEFRFQSILAKYDRTTVEGKKAILQDLLPVLKPRDVFDPVATEMRRLVIDHLKIEGPRLDEWVGSRTRRRLDTTQVKGMQRQGSTSQVAVIELETIALLLLEPYRLRERLLTLEAALPSEGDSLLREFHAICEAENYDDQQVLLHYRERDEGRILFERLFAERRDEDAHRCRLSPAKVTLTLARTLPQRREGKSAQEAFGAYARGQLVPDRSEFATDKLQQYYAELKEINAMLAARDAERRTRMPARMSRKRR